ncbi:hypothetical protein A4H97_05425 [Niastella yeongjuensis]|uniref:Uncharacterized protein n=1 Tax=Niastella yeongjuensis TaxID=354355 RepID=A0A1V9ELP1_9BACT|nr:hypothetical protein [Niastella yeongjuensis]OQP46962.1 hypothetical protein A4H97_05425 [Niastella yeongjuensis]SEN62744.1 hypothetical protein SAMN05660816_01109 [Niastella yeongjuensis]
MKLNRSVFIFRSLATGLIVFAALAFVLQQKNKRLNEFNNNLVLQNDSVLSVNLQLQKDINSLKHDLDSLLQNNPEKQQLTTNKLVSIK